jgi:hypothetical protein
VAAVVRALYSSARKQRDEPRVHDGRDRREPEDPPTHLARAMRGRASGVSAERPTHHGLYLSRRFGVPHRVIRLFPGASEVPSGPILESRSSASTRRLK